MMSSILRPITLIIGLGLLWQLIVISFNLPDYILPAPAQVITTLYQQRAIIATQSIPTLIEIILGFGLGILFGCLAGFILAFFKPLSRWFLPLLIISQAIPTFAIAPLLVIWLGYGLASKVATTILMIFFPIASSFYDGLRNTPSSWLDLAKTMNASPWRIFRTIQFKASLPTLGTGIRIAAVAAPIGAIVGEWVGSSRGLGYLMLNANARMQIDMMFAALLVIIALSLALYFSVDKLLRRWIWW
jgi:putative hydroxymethylpyrimidine transport system permease protein